MITLDTLKQDFKSALESAEAERIQQVLESFDKTCRLLIEQEDDVNNKKVIIETCLQLQKNWELQIIQLKAKVKGELADIRNNGKKIKKYLTSY
jgi:glycerol-3-phosphate O-acyltransferase